MLKADQMEKATGLQIVISVLFISKLYSLVSYTSGGPNPH